ncbi:MAG: DExH-box splicing factor binding site-domain-containing protein [Monoraphidium minutum]|nr:MAG: DExH-box splicing factor binding site-domain-containing protein [Monoraphidium minutum]
MADDPPKPAGGGGLGFSLAAKPRRGKVSVQVAERSEERQLITGIEGSRITAAEPEGPAAGPRVIPGMGNTYRAGVGRVGGGGGGGAGGSTFVPSFVPPASDDALKGSNEERFVAAPANDGTKAEVKHYGLQRMGGREAVAAAAVPPQEQQGDGGGEGGSGAAAGGGGGEAAEGGAAAEPAPGGGRDGAGAPLRAGYAIVARGGRNDKAALQEELGELPEEMAPEEYEATPVDEFAKALLRGMGWRDGEGVGRSRAAVEVKQIVPRPERLGLGADPAALPEHLKRPRVVKMGDKPRQDLVAAPGADGRARHRVGLDEALVPRETTLAGPRPGKTMRVVGGRHAGFAAVVKEVLPRVEGRSDRAIVRLLPSHEEVEVRVTELGEPGDEKRGGGQQAARGGEREPARDSGGRGERPSSRGGGGDERRSDGGERGGGGGKRSQRSRSRDRSGGGGGGGGGSRGGDGDGAKRARGDERQQGGAHQQHRSSSKHKHERRGGSGSSSDDSDSDAPPPPVERSTWLFPLIRVRLLDKRLMGGRLYLKKGVVVDVHPGALADVAVDETRQVVQLPEGRLETVVPKEPGRPVQVVAGPWRGRRGRLLQASATGGAAAVQLAGDMAVVRVALDDVAEYTGPLDEEDD